MLGGGAAYKLQIQISHAYLGKKVPLKLWKMGYLKLEPNILSLEKESTE